MGTTCHYNTTVAEMREYYLKGFEFSNENCTSTILEHTNKWALQKVIYANGRVECIPVWLNIYRRGDAVCEKLIDATCHPYQYDCPKKYLEMAKQFPYMPNGESSKYFNEWLEKAEQFAMDKPNKVKVEFGKTYNMTFSGHKVYIAGEYNRSCWTGYINGVRYKIKKNTIKDLAE
jgi:hypothetical protein